jgi:hypothetical protein
MKKDQYGAKALTTLNEDLGSYFSEILPLTSAAVQNKIFVQGL